MRQWGFSDPAKVKIHGYGGRRIADALTEANYADDLPEAASVATADGLVFYGFGPDDWVQSSGAYYHGELSPYSLYGYYYLTESAPSELPQTGLAVMSPAAAETAMARVHHEVERAQASEAGPLLVGEGFRSKPSQTFEIATPGRVNGSNLWLETNFVHTDRNGSGQLKFTCDGQSLPAISADRVSMTSTSHYVHASYTTPRREFSPSNPEKFTLGITYTNTGNPEQAALDYFSVNYTCALDLTKEKTIEFFSASTAYVLNGVDDNTHLWDVSDPHRILAVSLKKEGQKAGWNPTKAGIRSYVAWKETASLPAPEFVGEVGSQDLHAQILGNEAEMVIFAPAQYTEVARKLADFHLQADSLHSLIIDPETAYNEFSSGAADISGLRKCLKMIYDTRAAEGKRPLRYALLLGRPTLDHRQILASSQPKQLPVMPWWVVRFPRLSLTDNDGFGTDDFIAMLDDFSGSDLGYDNLSIAVGRMPITSAQEGLDLVDKLKKYHTKSRRTSWKNQILILADDGDQGVHLRQVENMTSEIEATPLQQHLLTKVYIDAFIRSAGTYPAARELMYSTLDRGAAWWIFSGHANNHSWTGDGMLTFTDLNNLYLKNVPMVVAATCDFLRWDCETISGAELMYKEPQGGAINIISATRPVYISDNAYFLAALGRQMLSRDADGNLNASGEVYRRLKNDIRNNRGDKISNSNRLRFVFMGDPALKLSTPSNIVEITEINGQKPVLDNEITLPAMSTPTVKGRVCDPKGQTLTDFTGTVSIDLFDALNSVTTLGNQDDGIEVFDQVGDRLYSGVAKVTDGMFEVNIPMPATVAENFRPATMSLYAAADNSAAEAIGLNRGFYVYGFEEPQVNDTIAPVIESLALNHARFTEGSVVNSAPMVLATVSDNVSINLSTAGIGRQMVLVLDGMRSFNDVSTYYTPSPDGSPRGFISYPLSDLSDGSHTLRLKVFDTSGNVAQQDIVFIVSDNARPQIFEVFTDANPAVESANFYVRHDRPEGTMAVSVSVYDLMGRPIWTGAATGQSENDLSAPVSWNLTDASGRRVPRGIYLYRASLSSPGGETFETASRRIAVAGIN